MELFLYVVEDMMEVPDQEIFLETMSVVENLTMILLAAAEERLLVVVLVDERSVLGAAGP